MAKRKRNQDGVVYREFGTEAEMLEESAIDVPPNQQQIRVQVSRKGKGGKTVSMLSGFQHSPEQLAVLVKQLKNQCGTGGTVKDGSVEIQGDHVAKLVEILLGLGYKAKKSGG